MTLTKHCLAQHHARVSYMVKKCFLSLFKAVLKLCVSKGMIRGKRQAVDSVLSKPMLLWTVW
jgi:hypothetical protein